VEGCDEDHHAGQISKVDLFKGTEEECQKECNVLPECNFIIYKRRISACYLFGGKITDLTRKCREIGGPKQPLLEFCPSPGDPCNVRNVTLSNLT
jgi:hypothetical protein